MHFLLRSVNYALYFNHHTSNICLNLYESVVVEFKSEGILESVVLGYVQALTEAMLLADLDQDTVSNASQVHLFFLLIS